MAINEYVTKDIGEASAILASGIKLLRLEQDGQFFWFIFQGKDTIKTADKYWSGDLAVIAKNYNDSYKTLRDRIFARKIGDNI